MVFVITTAGCVETEDAKFIAFAKGLYLHVEAFTTKDENGYDRVTSVSIKLSRSSEESKRRFNDALRRLNDLKHLEVLGLEGELDSDDLKALPPLSSLTTFAVANTQVADAGLQYLADMKNLRTLVLTATRVEGSGFAHLQGFSNLERLYISSTPLVNLRPNSTSDLRLKRYQLI